MASTPPDWDVLPPGRRRRTLWGDLAGLWARFRRLPALAKLILVAIALLVFVAVVSIPFRSGPEDTVASRSTTTGRPRTVPLATSTTTTIPPLPAGDDKTVKAVLDGDSFELDDGTKVRLLGIDAPDVETRACFSAEATSHLGELLPGGRRVRLVYDTIQTDSLGRTLAYVYRLSDGLFVNAALAKDGYAIQLTSGTIRALDTSRADEIGAAATSARAAGRGLWQTCQTTTSAGPGTTTAAASTTAPSVATTTTLATTTTNAPASTTSTPPASTTSTTRFIGTVVEQGGLCLFEGATAYFSTGAPAVCAPGSDGFLRWRAA